MGRPYSGVDFAILETLHSLRNIGEETGKRMVQEALKPESIKALKMLRKELWKEWQANYVEDWVSEILEERRDESAVNTGSQNV